MGRSVTKTKGGSCLPDSTYILPYLWISAFQELSVWLKPIVGVTGRSEERRLLSDIGDIKAENPCNSCGYVARWGSHIASILAFMELLGIGREQALSTGNVRCSSLWQIICDDEHIHFCCIYVDSNKSTYPVQCTFSDTNP